ncbi:MAG: hypothetical protein HOW73_01695 [Polyangiaceae bacterium]|nr:hypothetical protein [Polyangiaceae bacterium]
MKLRLSQALMSKPFAPRHPAVTVARCAASVPMLAMTIACSSGQPTTTQPVAHTATAVASEAPIVGTAAPLAVPSAAPKADAKAILETLDARVVDASHVARRALYSWTTRQQAEAIAAGEPALSRVESAKYGPSAFDWMLDAQTSKGDRLARLMFHEAFAKKRFAWPNAYATAPGNGGGRYGSVLMRIELKPDSFIVDFASNRVVDLDGQEVPFKSVETTPERIGAAYWEAAGFREYVVVNPSAISRISFGTEVELAAFEEERALLSTLSDASKTMRGEDQNALLARFAKTLAFSKSADVTLLRRLAQEANDVPPDRLAYTMAPTESFSLGAARPRLKDPKCRMKTTGDHSYVRTLCLPADRCAVDAAGHCGIAWRPLAPED